MHDAWLLHNSTGNARIPPKFSEKQLKLKGAHSKINWFLSFTIFISEMETIYKLIKPFHKGNINMYQK